MRYYEQEKAAAEWDDLRDALKSRQVFATQGGGRAEFDSQQGRYVFITKPNVPGLGVGDFVPDEWDVIPVK